MRASPWDQLCAKTVNSHLSLTSDFTLLSTLESIFPKSHLLSRFLARTSKVRSHVKHFIYYLPFDSWLVTQTWEPHRPLNRFHLPYSPQVRSHHHSPLHNFPQSPQNGANGTLKAIEHERNQQVDNGQQNPHQAEHSSASPQ